MKNLLLTLALLPIASCDLPIIIESSLTREDKLMIDSVVFISAAEAYTNHTDNPTPEPSDPVRPPSSCDNCNHKGWLGDGRPRSDCPLCDRDGDGSNTDPLPSSAEFNQPLESDPATKEVVPSEPTPALPKEDAVGQGNVPPPQTDWLTDYNEAGQLSYERGTTLVLILTESTTPDFSSLAEHLDTSTQTYLRPIDLTPFLANFIIPGVYISNGPIRSNDPTFKPAPDLSTLFFSEK